MIHSNLELDKFMKYFESIMKCLEFIKQNDMKCLEKGRHNIDGDNIYVNVFSYDTKDYSEAVWEAHKKYIDLHYVISGEEYIGVSDVATMEIEAYHDGDDYVQLHGELQNKYKMIAGSTLFLDETEAHVTGICCENGVKLVKKAVFKIRI